VRFLVAEARGLRRLDPGLFSLTRAARAAIVMPWVFAFADNVIGDPQTATFAAFGSIAFVVSSASHLADDIEH
jgi:hypothetical protein